MRFSRWGRATAVGLCLAVPAPAPLLGAWAFAPQASCACTRAACCCAATRPASGSCHEAKPDARDTRMRCDHAAPTLQLASAIAVCAPPTAVPLSFLTSPSGDGPAAMPRDALRAVDPPPPRALPSA